MVSRKGLPYTVRCFYRVELSVGSGIRTAAHDALLCSTCGWMANRVDVSKIHVWGIRGKGDIYTLFFDSGRCGRRYRQEGRVILVCTSWRPAAIFEGGTTFPPGVPHARAFTWCCYEDKWK